ncbi:MAG: peptidylprolyl isomerase [Planctomycetes bacterium]|nr:peptidylprolyl isomerase [Planctomycetota bacterium]
MKRLLVGFGFVAVLSGLLSAAAEQVTCRHILVDTQENAEKILKEIEAEAKAGKDIEDAFAEAAAKYSFDVATKRAGGEMPGFTRRAVEKPFADVAFALQKKGEIGGPVKTRYGWHLIQFISREGEAEVVPPPPPPGKEETTPPPPPPAVKRVVAEIEMEEKAFLTGNPIPLDIVIRNETDAPATVPRPELLAAGLRPRAYKMTPGGGGPTIDIEGIPVVDPPVVELAPGAFIGVSVDLAAICKDLAPTGRHFIAWGGRTLTTTLEANEKFKPITGAADYETWKKAWDVLNARPVNFDYRAPFSAQETYFVQFSVTGGRFYVELDKDRPKEVEYFWSLVRKEFYNDLTFHKVVAGEFVAGGDPFGDGTGRPKEVLTIPSIPKDRKHLSGTFSLAVRSPLGGAGAATVGSIFFICLKDLPVFDGVYLPIGKVVSGMDVVERLAAERGEKRIYSASIASVDELPAAIRDTIAMAPKASTEPLPIIEIDLENGGKMTAELYEDDAPNTVANFIELAESKFFDGQTFYRVFPGEYVQTGDPSGTGSGGPGWTIEDERNARKHERGALAMALKGPNQGRPDTAGSQFYICLREQPQLDGTYTVFGKVTQGLDVLDRIAQGDKISAIKVIRKRDHTYAVEKQGLKVEEAGAK